MNRLLLMYLLEFRAGTTQHVNDFNNDSKMQDQNCSIALKKSEQRLIQNNYKCIEASFLNTYTDISAHYQR